MADKDEVSRKCSALADLVRVGAAEEGGGRGQGGNQCASLSGDGVYRVQDDTVLGANNDVPSPPFPLPPPTGC